MRKAYAYIVMTYGNAGDCSQKAGEIRKAERVCRKQAGGWYYSFRRIAPQSGGSSFKQNRKCPVKGDFSQDMLFTRAVPSHAFLETSIQFLYQWNAHHLSGNIRPLWNLCMHALMWTAWLENRRVFEDISTHIEDLWSLSFVS